MYFYIIFFTYWSWRLVVQKIVTPLIHDLNHVIARADFVRSADLNKKIHHWSSEMKRTNSIQYNSFCDIMGPLVLFRVAKKWPTSPGLSDILCFLRVWQSYNSNKHIKFSYEIWILSLNSPDTLIIYYQYILNFDPLSRPRITPSCPSFQFLEI